MSPVILDFRNRNLVRMIEASPSDRIYVTYGAAHYAGVAALLERAQPPWTVESVMWTRPIAP
ncbi:MAG: hypothetical protein R2712_22250 [Vicinamibacterales bacterium]